MADWIDRLGPVDLANTATFLPKRHFYLRRFSVLLHFFFHVFLSRPIDVDSGVTFMFFLSLSLSSVSTYVSMKVFLFVVFF